jgi:hypothetical protein
MSASWVNLNKQLGSVAARFGSVGWDGVVSLSWPDFFAYEQLSDRAITDRSHDSSRSN